MKLSIIIPVFNEQSTISEVIERVYNIVLPLEKEIIVVNDASSDNTLQILQGLKNKFNFILKEHKKNQGKGAAIKSGLSEATGDFVIIQDADLEYSPLDYPILLQPLLDNKADVVYGSRNMIRNPRFSQIYFLGGKFLTFVFNLLYGTRLTDINTGYKVFKREIVEGLDLKEKRFAFCEEVTCKLIKKGYKIKEVPINYLPRGFKNGKKIRWWRDGWRGLRTIIRCRFKSSE
jgi:glycosyltransferase involved in cell wall biosynthesis